MDYDYDDMLGNYFNAHLCHVCKSRESFYHSKQCSACKLISYCSSEHQKADRKNHKSICQAAQKISNAWHADDVFDVGITSLLQRQELKQLMNKLRWPDFPPKSERTKVKLHVIEYIKKQLFRSRLKRFEMNMFYFPKHCAVCFARKNIPKEFVCTNCFGVAYCSAEHQRLDDHEKLCSEFKKVLDMDLFLLNVNLDSPEVHLLKPDAAVDLKLDVHNMTSFIAKYIKPGLKFEEEALISFYYTSVLTFAHTINRIPNFTLNKRVIIHIVGAHMDSEARVLEYWENLLHLFPKVYTVTIVHVSPSIYGPSIKLKLCDDCEIANRSIDIHFHEQEYHEYHYNACATKKPDVIIAFNSGLHDHDSNWDPWGPSLPLFFQFNNVPVILTEAGKWEAERDLERLLSIAKMQDKIVRVVVKYEKNPFNNFRPWQDWSDPDHSVYIKNSYVTALIVDSH